MQDGLLRFFLTQGRLLKQPRKGSRVTTWIFASLDKERKATWIAALLSNATAFRPAVDMSLILAVTRDSACAGVYAGLCMCWL